jgi:hypothetical protein
LRAFAAPPGSAEAHFLHFAHHPFYDARNFAC